MVDEGGFDHNGHTLRTLMVIEQPYPLWDGLNLTWETLEGLAKHNGPVRNPGWALAAADARVPLDLSTHAPLAAEGAGHGARKSVGEGNGGDGRGGHGV